MNGIGGDNVWLIYDAGRGRLRGLERRRPLGRRRRPRRLPRALRRRHSRRAAGRPRSPCRAPSRAGGRRTATAATCMGSPVTWPTLLADAVRHAREGFAVVGGPASRDGRRRRSVRRARPTPTSAARCGRSTIPDRLGGRAVRPGGPRGDARARRERRRRRVLSRRARRGASPRRARAGRQPAGRRPISPRIAPTGSSRCALRYRGGEAVSFPPPTQGFAALAILALLEGFDVAALDDADHVHLAVEADQARLRGPRSLPHRSDRRRRPGRALPRSRAPRAAPRAASRVGAAMAGGRRGPPTATRSPS